MDTLIEALDDIAAEARAALAYGSKDLIDVERTLRGSIESILTVAERATRECD